MIQTTFIRARIREIERMPKHELARLHVQQGGLMGLATYLKWRKEELVKTVLECEGIDPWDPRHGDTRACPDCGRPQHYTGTELGWCHDAGHAATADSR